MLLRKRLNPLLWTVYLTTFYTCGCLGQADVCGRPSLNTRIVGGQDAPAGSWPWQASVHSFGSHICGGSLINKQWVLSAAKCFASVSAGDLEVYLGRQNQEGSNPNEVKMTVSRIINHPDHDPSTLENDIALLQLSSPVSFTSYIKPVCLAANGSVFPGGVTSWVTGWGNTASGAALPSPKTLQEVKVAVIDNTKCNSLSEAGLITDNKICAGVDAGGRGPCQGDSGGPLVSKQDSVWVQSGIVSFEDGCGQARLPGVYTRVSRYQTWINQQISTNQPGFIQFTGPPVVTPASTTPETVTSSTSATGTIPSTTVTTPPVTVTTPSATVTTPPSNTGTTPSPTVTTPPSATVTTPPVTVTTTSSANDTKTTTTTAATTTATATTKMTPAKTTTTSKPGMFTLAGGMCRPQDTDKIAFPAVIVRASGRSSLNQAKLQEAIESNAKTGFSPVLFYKVKYLENERVFNVTMLFQLAQNESLCFPSDDSTRKCMENVIDVLKEIEYIVHTEVVFETNIAFEECENNLRGRILRVADVVSSSPSSSFSILYRRTIVLCRIPQRSRAKRNSNNVTEVEVALQFDPDALSNPASSSSTPSFPTKKDILAVLRNVSTELNLTIDTTSIRFTEAVVSTSLTTAVPEITSSAQSVSAQTSSTVSSSSARLFTSWCVVVTSLPLLMLLLW